MVGWLGGHCRHIAFPHATFSERERGWMEGGRKGERGRRKEEVSSQSYETTLLIDLIKRVRELYCMVCMCFPLLDGKWCVTLPFWPRCILHIHTHAHSMLGSVLSIYYTHSQYLYEHTHTHHVAPLMVMQLPPLLLLPPPPPPIYARGLSE